MSGCPNAISQFGRYRRLTVAERRAPLDLDEADTAGFERDEVDFTGSRRKAQA